MTGWFLGSRPVPQEPVPEPPLEIPDVVQEGGVLVIQVHSGAKRLGLVVPGHGVVVVPVPPGGRVEWRLPRGVRGGSTITISDRNYPNPAGGRVDVVGSL